MAQVKIIILNDTYMLLICTNNKSITITTQGAIIDVSIAIIIVVTYKSGVWNLDGCKMHLCVLTPDCEIFDVTSPGVGTGIADVYAYVFIYIETWDSHLAMV